MGITEPLEIESFEVGILSREMIYAGLTIYPWGIIILVVIVPLHSTL